MINPESIREPLLLPLQIQNKHSPKGHEHIRISTPKQHRKTIPHPLPVPSPKTHPIKIMSFDVICKWRRFGCLFHLISLTEPCPTICSPSAHLLFYHNINIDRPPARPPAQRTRPLSLSLSMSNVYRRPHSQPHNPGE